MYLHQRIRESAAGGRYLAGSVDVRPQNILRCNDVLPPASGAPCQVTPDMFDVQVDITQQAVTVSPRQ